MKETMQITKGINGLYTLHTVLCIRFKYSFIANYLYTLLMDHDTVIYDKPGETGWTQED
jgi:hypothetical protein